MFLLNKFRLREEVDRVLGSRNEVTNEDLANLKYTSCVIKETLRKWPPANGTLRKIDVDDYKIENYLIPRDSLVHVKINN